jgi:long-chain fatty acid transport protein
MKMKGGRRVAALALVGLGAAARPCRASGFLIYDLSGDAVGRGSAVSASVSEPAAVWFNPAALAFMGGASVSVGGVLVTAGSSFAPAAGGTSTESDRGTFFLPTLFAAAAPTSRVAVGVGVYTAFGIGVRWPDDWVGRESAIAASLETLAFNPTAAFKLDPRLSLAAGFDAVRAAVDFTNGLPALVGGDVRLGGGTWGYGFNVAALYRPLPERLHVALTYRSRVRLAFAGRADFSPTNPDFLPALPDQPGSATITLPDIVTLGVMLRPRADLTLELDVDDVRWSSYQRVDITFASAPARVIEPDGHDSFTVRAGADLRRGPRGLHLRGGLVYDQSAVPSEGLGPGLPDANRLDAAAGVGLGGSHWRADLGYMFVYFLPADATGGREGPVGTYRTTAHLVALTAGMSWL